MEEEIQLINDRAVDVPTIALGVFRELSNRQELATASKTKELTSEEIALRKILHYFFQQV